MSRARTAAVIPNWNGQERLERCIASLAAQRGAAADIIVADNASTDGSPEAAARAGARVVRLPRNLGFAAAVNRGVAASDSEFVAVINNDATLDPEWLARLEAALDAHPECGMVTGTILIGSGGNSAPREQSDVPLVDGSGDALSLGFAAARLGYGRPDSPSRRRERAVLAVSGAACLIRREVFRRVGGFEEAFFAYLEDADFCLRAQLAGFQARYIPEAVAWHEVSASSAVKGRRAGRAAELHPRVAAWITAHQLLLAARYARRGTLRVVLPRVVVVQALWAARLLFRGRALAWLRGLAIAAARLPRVRRWRFPDCGSASGSPGRMLELLRASEAQIYADRAHLDTFWRLYFRLFPAATEPVAGAEQPGAKAPDCEMRNAK